jgi:hypothetical protein
MRIAYIVACAVIAATVFVAPASAQTDSRYGDCARIASKVDQALETAQPGQATDMAHREATAGSKFCATARYDEGVSHYLIALRLLGKN